ncbi:sulfatase [Thalassoglobus sp. JC818]|uniref:sulfatase n=1 Tax=Thalassoglobus sp. JC818 TaxID=3232136 RepID=UPI003459892C
MISRAVVLFAAFACFAQSSDAQQSERSPNVLLIVSDDLQACLGCYQNSTCQTPNLDRLAKEGILFERAYCQYPVCGPSRASMMSGLYPNLTKMLGNKTTLGAFHETNADLAHHPSIGEFLKTNGYVSLRVSKIYHMGVPGGIEAGDRGGDDPLSWDRAFDIMAPETASLGELELLSPIRKHYGSNFARIITPDEAATTQTDYLAASQAIAILENRARGRTDSRFLRPEQPFFLAVGFVRPHVPLIAPKRIFDKYPVDSVELPNVPENDLDDVPSAAAGMENFGRYGMNEEQQKIAIASYYASVTFMDEQVGRLLETLDRLNLRDDTVVIFTSDHGYNLGEHHCWQKLSLFEDSTRVPLLISSPDHTETAGQTNSEIVELIDLYPTIADLCGLKKKSPQILQGQSLVPILESPGNVMDADAHAYTVTYQRGESLRAGPWRFNRWGNSGEELYDHESDPGEFTNLATDPDHTAAVDSLRTQLTQVRESSEKSTGSSD